MARKGDQAESHRAGGSSGGGAKATSEVLDARMVRALPAPEHCPNLHAFKLALLATSRSLQHLADSRLSPYHLRPAICALPLAPCHVISALRRATCTLLATSPYRSALASAALLRAIQAELEASMSTMMGMMQKLAASQQEIVDALGKNPADKASAA